MRTRYVTIRPTPLLCLTLVLGSCTARETRPVLVPLQYEPTLVKADFPNPVVRLTFNRRTAWFILDTGAGVHTLAQWFVDADGMKIRDDLPGAPKGIDSSGHPVTFRAVQNQVARLRDRTRLSFDVAMVAAFPPDFEAADVGGLINPQLLAHGTQAVSLDLRVPELRIEPFEDAVRRLGARLLPGDQMRSCGSPEATVPNRLFAVFANSPHGTGWLQLDTGAAETTLTSESTLAAGMELESGGETIGVGGKPRRYSRARNLAISFAGHVARVDAQVAETRAGACGPDGMLGLDAMRGCAFVFSNQSLALACQP